MMQKQSILDDLHAHGDWSNRKLLSLCSTLSDAQLDEPREMGFGSLRNTCFHILEAEKLWLDRYQGKPWRTLQADASGMSITTIQEQLNAIALQRDDYCKPLINENTDHTIAFEDLGRRQWSFPLRLLQLHVANHGIHHRAQILSFLRQFGTRVAGGVDYLFFKLAYPSVTIPQESHSPLREYGLEVDAGEGAQAVWDQGLVESYLSYDAWATEQVLASASDLSDKNSLDAEIEMGPGSLRKTLQHMLDANRWWLANWETEMSPFPRGEEPRSLESLSAMHTEVVHQREQFVGSLDEESAARIVSVTAGGPVTCFRVLDSLLQLAGHGTHHRAQCLNMIRRLGGKPPTIDLIEWLRVRKLPT